MTDWHTHPGPDPAAQYQAVKDILGGLPGLRGGIHMGGVVGTLPTDAQQRVYPYVVVWAGVGTPIRDPTVAGRTYQAGQTAEFTTTIASGDWSWTAHAARDVRHALTDALDGRVKPEHLQQRIAQVMRDPAERPHRFYIPLTWTLTDHA